MATIVAGRFDNIEQAERALEALHGNGFQRGDAGQFFVNPPGQHDENAIGGDQFADAQSSKAHVGAAAGAAAGGAVGIAAAAAIPGIGPVLALGVAALGAYTGSLVGTLSKLGDASGARELGASPGRSGGMMVAVRVDDEQAERIAIDTLRQHAAADIERARGEWRDGQWHDFDAVAPPNLVDKAGGKS